MYLDLDAYTFGVEIEFTGITRSRASSVLAKALDSSKIKHIGGSFDKYSVTDSSGRSWLIISDASISPQKMSDGTSVSAGDKYKVEFVTPVLKYSSDIETLQKIVRSFRSAGAFVNNSTGCHVHVGAVKHTPKSLRNLINIFSSKQDMLYKALTVQNQRTRYCKNLESEFIERLNKRKPQTKEKFADEYYKNFGGYSHNQGCRYSNARYYGLNYHSYFEKGTVEFRLFNSTLHAGWIRTYVILALAMNNQAIMQTSASPKVPITDNECYTFRTWLLRMGFIGDEYSVPRKLLVSNLEGNTAWRYGESRCHININSFVGGF